MGYFSDTAFLEPKEENNAEKNDLLFQPVFFHIKNNPDKVALEQLLLEKPYIKIYDTIRSQIIDLIKTNHPSKSFSATELEQHFQSYIKPVGDTRCLGAWIYYPWSEKLVHVLEEKDFISLRTNRNKYKITDEERALLSKKKVGVIGLSVGQSVALTLAMERSCGELRIADYDTLELTNLNRIRTGLHNLGTLKTVCVAREIAEIDPYLKVSCFHEGITKENIEDFFFKNGKLDIVVDECDSIDIKIALRLLARKHGIPVVMDTSDRGMLDIERFDLEPDRPIFHGRIKEEDLPSGKETIPSEQRIALSVQIVGIDSLSQRLKDSLAEINKSISTWPQLATSVFLGGAVAAKVCRYVLLKQHFKSGRFYIDVEKIIE